MGKEENLGAAFIPANVVQSNRLLGFKKRNIAEGFGWAFLFALLVNAIPFVPKVKWILIIVVGVSIIALNAKGIHDSALSTVFISFYKYRKYMKTFHYRRFKKEYSHKDIVSSDGQRITTIKTGSMAETLGYSALKAEEQKKNAKNKE